MTGVKLIKEGDLDHVIHTKSLGLYRILANDINSITDGLKAAVHKKMKSDRMRTNSSVTSHMI